MARKFTTIEEVRDAIDRIDMQIMHLLGERLTCAKEIVQFKDPSKEGIVAINRYNEVIEKRRLWALEKGLNPDVIEKMYRTMMDHFIEEEMKLINNQENK